MTTNFLTKEGFQKLQEELEYLRTTKRMAVAARLHEAMEGGELIENAEYEAAKNEQAFVEGRIQELELLLATAKIIEENGKGKKSDIDDRIKELRTQLKNTDSKFDKEKLEERVAKLSGGVAVIRVGAATETEMKYLKDKIEDAVNATKAAVDEGIIEGGGVAIMKIGMQLNTMLNGEKSKYAKENLAFKAGYATVINACRSPIREIIRNGNHDVGIDSDLVAAQIADKGVGYDARRGQVVNDMIKEGIIDPVKVTRSALLNAASAAAIFLTTDAAVADEPEDKKAPVMPGGMEGME